MRRVQEVKSSCSILSQQMARDRRPMLVTRWHPLMLSSRKAVVCLAIHHRPTSVTCMYVRFGLRRSPCVFLVLHAPLNM